MISSVQQYKGSGFRGLNEGGDTHDGELVQLGNVGFVSGKLGGFICDKALI